MTKVFIGGSRKVSRLNADVKRRLDNIIEKGFTVLIGDANGADKAVQAYLASKRYLNVEVFCMAGGCRNNVGRWPTREIVAAGVRRGFEYYATKDRVMADEASCGLMIWDAQSRGTLNNISTMVQRSKPVVVYLAREKRFRTLRRAADVSDLLHRHVPQDFDYEVPVGRGR